MWSLEHKGGAKICPYSSNLLLWGGGLGDWEIFLWSEKGSEMT